VITDEDFIKTIVFDFDNPNLKSPKFGLKVVIIIDHN
jgi:hypothetical protein